MILTNKAQLPDSVVNVVKKQIYKPREDRIRVSELIHNPLVKKLTLDHWDEITADASEFFNVIMGTSVHYILEQMAGANVMTEFTMQMDIPGTNKHLKGTLDRANLMEDMLEDHKVVSVWSLIFGAEDGYKDYQTQANLYRWMYYHVTGIMLKRLRLNAYLRDWSQRDAERDKKYPKIPFQFIELPVWELEQVKQYVNERLALHLSGEYVECSSEEKWQRPTVYAIKEQGKPRAKLATNPNTGDRFMSEAEALEIVSLKKWDKDLASGKLIIEERPGECIKCERYCLARDICPYSDKSKVKHVNFEANNKHDVSDKNHQPVAIVTEQIDESTIVAEVAPTPVEVVNNPPVAKAVSSEEAKPKTKKEERVERKAQGRRGRPKGSKNKSKE